MKLKSVRIQNFKAIADCDISLTDATILVGPNNAGKSSILQAIHFASRSLAQASEANKQSTMSLSEIEYIPSSNYRELAHRGVWGNIVGSPESKVSFTFEDPTDTSIHVASVILKSARNEGISINPQLPAKIIGLFRGRDTVFSSYIPGIAGIPLQEVLLPKRHTFRKAASGDSNVVLRNILILIKKQKKLEELRSYVRDIYSYVFFDVHFDEDKDFDIRSTIKTYGPYGGSKPLEFAGTGFLQVLQIFSYLVLFRPQIILIDEPESHLHPTLQTQLVRKLHERVAGLNSVALITTHSPFVARGLPLGSRTVWIDGGKVVAASSDETIREALGWGALDKPILLCTEDHRITLLNEIISQDDSLADKVSIFPFDGVSKLGSASILSTLRNQLGNKHKLVVHRDRDCMIDSELSRWCKEYEQQGITPWITSGSDIEMYFCGASYLSQALGIPESDAAQMREAAFRSDEGEHKRKFGRKRAEINRRIYETSGGSPSTDQLWESSDIEVKICGKDFIPRLRELAKLLDRNEKLIGRKADGVIVAPELIGILREFVE